MQNRQQRKQRLEQQAKSMQTEKSLKDSSDSESTMPSTAEDEDGHLNVEEILWSQQNYRIKSHQSNTMRLLDMLENDVQLKAQKRPRPFLENSGGGISRRRNAKPEQIELMDWYDRDCLLIHRNWAELSADANARRGASRVNLAAKLPRHTFECDDIAMVAANDDVEAQETATTRTRAYSISSSNGGCATNGAGVMSRSERKRSSAGPEMELCCETVGEQKLDEWRKTARRKARGELLVNLAAPGPLNSVAMEDEEQQSAVPSCWSGQRRLSVKFTRLTLLPPLENIFATVALYDVKTRQKLSENFHLDSSNLATAGKCDTSSGFITRALFKLPEEEGSDGGAGDGLMLVFRLEKALQQGGLDAALKAYTKKQSQKQDGQEDADQMPGQKPPKFRQQIGIVALPIARTVENAFNNHEAEQRQGNGGSGSARTTFNDSFIRACPNQSMEKQQNANDSLQAHSDKLSDCSSSAGLKFYGAEGNDCSALSSQSAKQPPAQSQLLRCHRWSRHLFGCPLSVQVSHFLKCEPLAEAELFDWLQALLGTGGGQQSKQNNSRNSEKIPLDLRLELEMCQLEDVAREGWRIVSPECRLLNLTSGPQNVDGNGDEQREEWMEQLEGSPLLAQDMLPFPVFPRLILPNSFARNLLFLYPRFVNFSARTGQTAARNICVHVELLDAQLRRLDAFVDGGSCLVGTVHTPVTYHSKQPQFGGVEWKLLLPFDPPEGLHLRFKFVHVSCRPGETAAGAGKSAAAAMPAQTETPIGFSWLPLHPTADAPLPTGDQHLPISLDPLPPAICFLSPHLPFPHVHWLDGHRPLFQLSLQLVSSIQPQDTHLSNFLRLSSQWNAITITTDSSSPPPNMVEELAQAVRNLLKIRPEPMLAFLHILLHRILAILQTSSVAESALSQCCFDILCQLAKITTVLLNGHVDKWGRSRILLDFVREQALPEVGQMVDLSNGNGMSEKRKKEKTMLLTPISVGRGRVGSKKSREKLSNTEDNAKDISAAEGTAAIKHDVLPLHEHLARLFLGSQGTARDMACSICWFPLSLIQRSMAEHLVRSGGQLLPPKARFSATFIACLDKLGKLVADELFDQLQKNFAQTQAINQAWAKFLRESISLLLHSFVLRQFKRLCRLMDAHIETLQAENPALADKVLSLKLAFIRTLYSHEHFLFLCLPFAELPTTNPPPTAAAAVEIQSSLLAADGLLKRSLANLATAARRIQYTSSGSIASSLGSRTHHKMSTSKSQSVSSALFGHPSEEHAHKHFPVSLLLSQLHSLIITNSPSMPACVDLLHWLIAGHESDWRLKDPELRHQLALIYSPLLAIVLAIVLELMSGSREGGEQLLLFSAATAGETTAGGTSAADPDQCSAAEEVRSNKSAGGTAGGGKRRRWTRARKKLLLCLCWLLRSLHQPTLLQHLRQFSPIRVTQFVLLLRSLVSMFAQPLPVPPSQQQRRNSTDSFVQIGPVQADEFHLLLPSIEQICPPPPAAPPTPTTSNKITTPLLGWYRSVENKLSDRDLGGRQAAAMEERSNSSSHKGMLLLSAAAEDEEANAPAAAAVHVRWRKDGGDEAEDNTPTERVIARQLSTEVLLLVLDQFELLLQLAPSSMPSPLLPELMGLLLHILSGHNSLAAQQHIFRTQRAFVRKFPNFLFDGQNNTVVLEQQQQRQFLSGLCLQLLRHMSSELAETRADAALSAFTLLRVSQRLHKGAFIRLNKAFTMSLSSLVSNAAASGSTLNDAALRQSLEAILQFRDGAETKSSKESAAAWRSQLEELVVNLSAILSDTLKLGACGDDFEMAVDLMERIAHGYRTNPELRIAWLMAIARKHLKEERRNYAEAAQCLLHCCAIMADQLAAASNGGGAVDEDAELLPQQPVFQAFEELMGDNVREEWPRGRAAAVQGVGRAAEQQQQEQPMFSLNTFAEMVEKMAKLFERAQLFELIPTLFKLVLPMHERRHAHAKQIQLYAQIAACLGRVEPPPQLLALGDDWPATGTGNCLADKRCFGTYFRVRFFGARFGGDLDGQDFVYKEPAVTKLAEISHRFEDLYAAKFGPNALHMIKDSNEVNQKSLDPSQAYIQIIYVEPHFERREQKRRRTHLQRSYRLKQFLYATPFTQQGGKAHGSLGEQFKRKTVLTVENSFPYVKTRLRVIRQESTVLTPIEVAIEDVQKRSRELAWAVGARPVDAKILQMHLQGCIGATVNQGPLEIARVFLTGASLDASGLPRDAVQRRLRLCFDELGRRCAEALEINERLLGSDREDYQKELRRNMAHFEQSLAVLSRRPSTPPSSSSSSSAVLLDPGVTR